jgi:hypothetical protein
MVRTLAVLFAAVLAVPVASRAQDAKSADLARQFVQLLDQKKLDAIAAADAQTPGSFAAALYFPGTQLLVVSAKYSAPALMNEALAKKDYHEVYVDLSSASIASTKVFVMDTFADGLMVKPKGDAPADSVETAGKMVTFDGDYKKLKQSEAEYTKSFDDADAAYSRILQVLIGKLKSGT